MIKQIKTVIKNHLQKTNILEDSELFGNHT